MVRELSTHGENTDDFSWKALKKEISRKTKRWEDNAKTNLREIGWDGMDWIDLGRNIEWWRTHENGNEPSGFIKC
jgi:hypothetical protein